MYIVHSRPSYLKIRRRPKEYGSRLAGFRRQRDPDRIAEAQSLNPIYSRKVLGRTAMLFDSPGATLDALGEISTPSVADLFVATMQENSAYQGASQGGSSS